MISEYVKVMTIIAGSFGAEVDEPTVAFWSELFKEDGISVDQIKAAAKEIIRTRKYKSMPTYAEFIEFCEGTADDKARIQADKVVNAIKVTGSYGKPSFVDPVTDYIINKTMSWAQVCMTESKNMPFFIRDFIEKYKTYAKDFRRKQIEQVEYRPELKQLAERIG